MDIAAFLNRFSSRQRISVMLVIGTILLGVMVYNDQPEVAVAPSAPVKQPAAGAPGQPQLPKGYEPEKALRDPFAMPKEFEPAKPAAPSSAMPATGTVGRTSPAAATMVPVLNGVVGGEGKWMAIIQYGTESRSYQVRDYVGPYQIVAITADSVTVSGPGGRRVLTVGR